jgi:hypothetical protein
VCLLPHSSCCPQLTVRRSFFPPRHINKVSAFQDTSLLENVSVCSLRNLLLEKTRDKTIMLGCKTAALAGNILHRIHRA